MRDISYWRMKRALYRLEGNRCQRCGMLHFPCAGASPVLVLRRYASSGTCLCHAYHPEWVNLHLTR